MTFFCGEWLPIDQYCYLYKCGYCKEKVRPSETWMNDDAGNSMGLIYICPNCKNPTFVEIEDLEIVNQIPSCPYDDIEGLPEELNSLYKEARECSSINAPTAAALLCRKIIKYVALERGADTDHTFNYYVKYLYKNKYLPKDCKDWIDHISKLKIDPEKILTMDKDDASDLVTFTELLLRIIYGSSLRLKKRKSATEND